MIEISEVINWLRDDSVVSRRGPNAIVVVCDFFDYDITTQVFQLPDDDVTVINQITEIMGSIIDPGAEDSSAFIKWGSDTVDENKREWDYNDITNMGKPTVLKELMDLLKKHYNGVWKVGGWQSGNESWEVEYRRHNFV